MSEDPKNVSAQDEWDEPIGQGLLIKWDRPKKVEGVYKSKVQVTGKFGLQWQYTIALRDGTVANFFSPAILERLMAAIEPETLIQIEMTGKTIPTKSGQPAKEFVLRPAKKVTA